MYTILARLYAPSPLGGGKFLRRIFITYTRPPLAAPLEQPAVEIRSVVGKLVCRLFWSSITTYACTVYRTAAEMAPTPEAVATSEAAATPETAAAEMAS